MIKPLTKGENMENVIRKSKLTAKQKRLVCNAYQVKENKSHYDKSWILIKKEIESLRSELDATEIWADNGDGLGVRGLKFIPKERSFFDIKKFSKENPELYKKYLDKLSYVEYKTVQ